MHQGRIRFDLHVFVATDEDVSSLPVTPEASIISFPPNLITGETGLLSLPPSSSLSLQFVHLVRDNFPHAVGFVAIVEEALSPTNSSSSSSHHGAAIAKSLIILLLIMEQRLQRA
ncbi:unnamed protein product [Sphagnum troendelagicum]|uniref:Uncharacterized protein n=1 Tax=Sphagnum troendelagicum TaxID=128251 RepID=A0ABP0UNX2_9BRYO